MKCIDVETRFAEYKLGYDDKAFAGTQDPWHKLIQCKHGSICPSGGRTLWAYVKNGKLAKRIRSGELEVFVVKQDGTDGLGVEFEVENWKVVFELMGAKRR